MVNLGRRLAAVAPALIRRLSTKVRAAAPSEQADRLYRRLSALSNTGMVSSTINEYIREGKTVTKPELERCVTELRKYKHHRLALEIMEWMEFRKFNFKHANYAVRLDLTAKAKGIDAAEAYFNSLPPNNKVHCVYGALLNCYCNALMVDKALKVFDTMVREKMMSRSLPYNNLMSMYSRLGKFEKVLALGEEMEKGDVEPDTCTYNILMNSYGQLNDVEGAERVFEEMSRDKRKLCDWTSYSNLANIYIKAGYQEKAKLALQRAEKEMDSKDRMAYHFLISLYAGLSDLDQVHRIWSLLKSNMEVITNRSYLIMLEALGKLGDTKYMMKCYKEWESKCSTYDAKLAYAVIRDYLTHDMVEEAEEVLEVAMSRSIGPFFYAWEQMMKYYLAKNQIKRALEILERAADAINWRPEFVLDRFIDYFKKGSDVESAEEFYKVMKRINFVNSRVYEALLETYEASGEIVPDMRSRIERDGVDISFEMERLLASVCPEFIANPSHRGPSAASALLRIFSPKHRAQKAAPRPVKLSPTLRKFPLFRILTRVSRVDGAVKNAINAYKEEGNTVSKVELEKCLKDFRIFKRYHHALEIGEWMQSQKLEFTKPDHVHYLDAIAKVKGIAAAENYFNALPPFCKVDCTYGVLLRCYCDEKMSEKALDLFSKMVAENIITSPWPFNHLINMHIQLGQAENAIQLGEELKKANFQPNAFTYGLLINGYARLDDFEGMERVVAEMKSEKTKVCKWTVYSCLANIYLQANDHEKARLALIDLEKEMRVNDREAYHFLISFYTQMSDADNVRRVWKSLKSARVASNTSYLVMLRSLDKLDDMERMKECFKEWETASPVWDGRLANTLIGAYLKRDMLEEAELALNSLPDKSEGAFFYALKLFMFFYLEKKHDLRKALEFMEIAASSAIDANWKPGIKGIDAFLKYFEVESDVSGAEEFYEVMKRMKCVDSHLYESLLRTYVGAGRKLGDFRGRIERDGVEISSELEELIATVSLS